MINNQFSPIILDVSSTQLTAADKQILQHPLVGGVIHFARNWQDRAQLQELNQEIKAIRPDLLIAVDHEGGRVQRFQTDGFTVLPNMAQLGRLYQQNPTLAEQTAQAVGYVLASELRACGVDFSFTPVLDLDYANSQVIGNRAFSADFQIVAELAQQLMQGLQLAGMANCGKHFPGHGYVAADSHLEIPTDGRSLEQILAQDCQPYQILNAQLKAVMPAHVIYSHIDSKPAGFSNIWLQQILRQKLGFNGAIISDDLSMAAARQIAGVELTYPQATLLALQAGCDLVLLCNQSPQPAILEQFLTQLEQEIMEQNWQPDSQSQTRRLQLLPSTTALTWQDLQQQSQYKTSLELIKQLKE